MSVRRPEHKAPPELYYNDEEARKYTSSSRMITIQQELSERALELMSLPEDTSCFILDIGCGSGLSGEILTDNDHVWVGVDISHAMLKVAKEREVEGDLILLDMGQGLGFRAGTFDAAMSISAIQWLCNADKKSHSPPKRLYQFFSSLYAALKRGSRAVFQFYPENGDQIELITQQAMRAGFTGGLVVDHPESTKAKKMHLVLFTGGGQPLPKGLGTENAATGNTISNEERRLRIKQARGKPLKKSRQWIQDKKERRRRQGKQTREDSKFSGRKRNSKF
uniref:18S rRNA (guanine-N(7))-methyltransferase n=1 Tax=Strigamia maritima TaxID=126957 RepID=T1JKW4_STRMM